MAVDGYLNFDTKLDVTGINNGFTKVNSTIAKGVDKAKNMFSDLAKAAAAALSLAALVNFGKECIELGSDLAEVQNVVRCQPIVCMHFTDQNTLTQQQEARTK